MEHIAYVHCLKCGKGGDVVPVRMNWGEFEEYEEFPVCDHCGNDDPDQFEIIEITAQ